METTVAAMIRAAGRDQLSSGWVFLPSGPITANTRCIRLADDEEMESLAASLGFPDEGLSTEDLSSIFHWTQQLAGADPSDDQLLRSYTYYLKFDAFLPSFDTDDPPPPDEAKRRRDRQFYEKLGPERADVACREAGCSRGAIAQSVFCRPHHFASVMGRLSPFDD